MTERSEEQRTEEFLRSPEYWDGHSLEDDCAWAPPDYDNSRTLDRSQSKEAWKAITEVLNAPKAMNIRVFKKKEAFNPTQQDLGSVVRFTRESLDEREREKPILHEDAKYFGIVTEGSEGARLVFFRDYAFDIKGMYVYAARFLGFVEKQPITVGQVKHSRVEYPKTWRGTDRSQSQERVNTLKIIGHGIAIREPLKERRDVFVRQLNPQGA